MGAYLRPGTLEAAIDALATGARPPTGPGSATGAGSPARPWIVVAGATDHFPARVGRWPDEDILDVTAIDAMRGVESVDGGWRIGALTTWTDLVETELPPLFDGLKHAARAVGGLQIQARGTIVGNVCNASPAADGMPNLLAMDAMVELASSAGLRRLPIGDFVVGNRRTTRAADELVTAILVPAPLPGARVRTTFEKLGSRAYLVISIAMVAAIAEIGPGGEISRVRVAVGACSEVAQRLPELEASLAGIPADAARARLADLVRPEHVAGLRPIDDVRGTAAYRADAALELVRRALATVLA